MTTAAASLTTRVDDMLGLRNQLCEAFFAREAECLALACREMSDRFLQGGKLLAFGRGASATDAQHVSVEFVHPVIVGKRALPALDLSADFARWVPAIVQPCDMALGFAPPERDADVLTALEVASGRGAMTFALPGSPASYELDPVTEDPFIHQEIVEILYHTLWETVHVFFERRELGHDVGEAQFLYPFLGSEKQSSSEALSEVAVSIQLKAADDAALRQLVSTHQAHALVETAAAIHERLRRGAKLIMFGNGGSATDANDFALDCVSPPRGYRSLPAISLAMEPANVTAIANDVGADLVFLRQLIALARPDDVAVAFSTSGGSRNIMLALEEARRRGLMTVAFLGYDGGEIGRRGLADRRLMVSCDYIPRIQEIHASMYHVIRVLLEVIGRG